MTFYNRIAFPAYYNDFDEGSVAWLAELMKQGHIPPGEIDRRSILDVCVCLTFAASSNAISSRVSGAGPMRCGSLVCLSIFRSGPDHPLANHSL